MEIEREVNREKILTNGTTNRITKNIPPKISDKQLPSFSAQPLHHKQKNTSTHILKRMGAWIYSTLNCNSRR
ncbi:MAG: hypothetical protein WCT49_00625 [Candidatus Paceibacterota bacterium]|jgi:hypothetical protein|nr:hypothetical protein [Candidatus Paceibacterota bacterium]